MTIRKVPFSAFAMLLVSCMVEPTPEPNRLADEFGYRPVYNNEPGASGISWQEPRVIHQPGKIYLYHDFLLINEVREGIHVFDNADPSKPIPLGFINILGNTDMAIKDNILYADHMGDLVAVTIDDFGSLLEQGRLELSDWDKGLPPPAGFYFQCVDRSKGLVIGWKKVERKNLDCYAIR